MKKSLYMAGVFTVLYCHATSYIQYGSELVTYLYFNMLILTFLRETNCEMTFIFITADTSNNNN